MTLEYKCTDTLNDRYLIENLFKDKRKGFFVEIGAANGIDDSSAYLLETYFDWNGLAIEANSAFFSKLQVNRKCVCVNAAVSDKNGKSKFIECEDKYYSVLYDKVTDWHKEKVFTGNYNIVDIETRTIENILTEHNCPKDIDFISIDVEGAEFTSLKDFPFDKFNVGLFIIENNDSRIIDLLKFKGYKQVENEFSKAPWELYFIKESYFTKKTNTSIEIIEHPTDGINTDNKILNHSYILKDVIIDNSYLRACTPLFWHNKKRVLRHVDRVRGAWHIEDKRDIYSATDFYKKEIEDLKFEEYKNSSIETSIDKMFLLFCIFNDNIGHFLLESISRLWYYNDMNLDVPVGTVQIYNESEVMPSLDLLLSGFVNQNNQLKLEFGKVYHIKELIIPGWYTSICDSNPFPRRLQDFYDVNLLPDAYTKNADKLHTYISRQDIVKEGETKNQHWHNRILLNEVELIKKLQAKNYNVIELKKRKSTIELIDTFKNSSKITMLMGAAAHLIVFCNAGTEINLIRNERMRWCDDWFKVVATQKNLELNILDPDCDFYDVDTDSYLIDENKINVPWSIKNLDELVYKL